MIVSRILRINSEGEGKDHFIVDRHYFNSLIFLSLSVSKNTYFNLRNCYPPPP